MTTYQTDMEVEKLRADISNLMADTIKLNAETMKLAAEASKINRERTFYPFTVLVAAIVAGVALARVLFG